MGKLVHKELSRKILRAVVWSGNELYATKNRNRVLRIFMSNLFYPRYLRFLI